MFFKKNNTKSNIDYLIVGLGNPGLEYEKTRHNAGFMVLDFLANKLNLKIKNNKYKAQLETTTINSKKCLLVKPMTYMNNSGTAVGEIMNFYKLSTSQLIVVCDDISLPVGKIRIRRKGSHGGQNGLRDIIEVLGKDDFTRIKVGIGAKPHPDYDLASWVLSKFKKEENALLNQAIENSYNALLLLVQDKIDDAMAKFN